MNRRGAGKESAEEDFNKEVKKDNKDKGKGKKKEEGENEGYTISRGLEELSGDTEDGGGDTADKEDRDEWNSRNGIQLGECGVVASQLLLDWIEAHREPCLAVHTWPKTVEIAIWSAVHTYCPSMSTALSTAMPTATNSRIGTYVNMSIREYVNMEGDVDMGYVVCLELWRRRRFICSAVVMFHYYLCNRKPWSSFVIITITISSHITSYSQ